MGPDNFKKEVEVFIISDSTGMTAEMVIGAVLVQFEEINPVFKKYPYIQTKEQIETVLGRAQSSQGLVIYSLVSEELREWIKKEQRKFNVLAIDLLGPILERIQKLWKLIPVLRPGIFRGIEEESLKLAEAIDYTLKHDDGLGLETLDQADLLILGVSRTSKTPTSLYLSCNKGLKVANVPLILTVEPPPMIYSLPLKKVGLTIQPERLASLRRTRLKYAPSLDYTRLSYIRQELDYCHRIFDKIEGLEVIDVSNTSIEETARTILDGVLFQV
jgi:hypothetical protein